jgi:hypothetical protein
MPTARPCRVAATVAALCAMFLGPTPAAQARGPSAQSIVDSELAFERAATEHGTRAGFLEYLADSAVLLNPAPTPARAETERGPAPGAPLHWRPDLAHIAGSGDFGWASGPFVAWASSTRDPPSETGHYLTAWRREADGSWRVVLDGGVPYAVAAADLPHHLEVRARLRRPGGGNGHAQDCSAAFGAYWQQKGRAKALKEFLADDARLLYAGLPPRDGRAVVPQSDPLAPAALATLRVARTLNSDAGDVQVSYGEYDLAARLDVPARRYAFVQAWDVGRGCRLALEMLNPAR